MKKRIVLIVIGLVIILGFVIGVLSPPLETCTEMGCPCGEDGERLCNSCNSYNPVFVSGILNVGKSCSAKEIITCQDGVQVDRRVELENNCKYELLFFRLY